MTRTDFETKDLKELIIQLHEEDQDVCDYQFLLEFAMDLIKEDNIGLALHILNAVHEDPADYYEYDFNMGTLQTPSGITEKSHIEHLIDE